MTHAIISKEIAALDSVIDGASQIAAEALARKADLKQGRLASESYGRVVASVKTRLEMRLNQSRLIELEAKIVEADAKEEPKTVAGEAPIASDEQRPKNGG